MEYNFKMITIYCILSLLASTQSLPQQRFRIPAGLSPAEVNSLELGQPVQRSIKTNHQSNNIEDTIKEVEHIIQTNPTLPRLTRGEILDIIENITKLDGKKSLRDPKAIMVVMPYTPSKSDGQTMEDLYTKPPVTHIIGEPFKSTQDSANKIKHTRRRPTVSYPEEATKKTVVDEKKRYEVNKDVTKVPLSTTAPRTSVRRRRPELSTTTTTVEPVTTYRPRKAQTTTYRPEPVASTYRPTRRPVRRRTTTTTTAEPEIITYRNHRYPQLEEKIESNEGIRIINSPKLDLPGRINDDLSDLNVDYDTKHEVILKSDFAMAPSLTTQKPVMFQPTLAVKPAENDGPITQDIQVPEHLRNLMQSMNLESALNPETTTYRPSKEDNAKIREMLNALTTTTTTLLPNAANVAESLSPDMRDLLMSFGLLENPNSTPEPAGRDVYIPDKAEVKPESYVGFKPLPEEGPGRDDMDALLASFGLGRNARREKSMKIKTEEKKVKDFDLDMIPSEYKDVIKDIGLNNRQEKKVRSPSVNKTVEKQHVFNPDTQYATEDELKKLEKLIGMLKQLEKMNGTINDDTLKQIDVEGLKDLIESLNSYKEPDGPTLEQLENGPDPNNFDSGLIKNEVKRQKATESSVSTSISIVEAVTVPASSTTTTEEAKTPNIKDLEASFGGGASETASEATLPDTTTPRRTGFYSLVDWNTFLDIDDTKGRRVNLRLQPKSGDPQRFYSVSVP